MSENWKIAAMVGGGVLLLLTIILLAMSVTTVPAGHVGIVTSFGQVVGEPIEPGLSLRFPWRGTTTVSLQTQESREEADVPTKEGLTVHLEASLIYSVEKKRALDLYVSVGPNFKDVVVLPQFRSALRGITVRYDAKDLYTAHRAEIEDALEKSVGTLLAERGIRCEKVLLRNIAMPPVVKSAIEKKLASEQEAAAMEFVILRETKEAERKRVEAKGLADSQDIIHKTLTPEYLRYLWIKSLQEAKSHGATTIYIPTDGTGLPVFREASGKAKE